mmetsp:Transcript_43747/g.64241  ORF Transcript_43747/g.64241 Transcript_43747/m.64241 type:complete len:452 (+) Transcript_43747:85-1440(+)
MAVLPPSPLNQRRRGIPQKKMLILSLFTTAIMLGYNYHQRKAHPLEKIENVSSNHLRANGEVNVDIPSGIVPGASSEPGMYDEPYNAIDAHNPAFIVIVGSDEQPQWVSEVAGSLPQIQEEEERHADYVEDGQVQTLASTVKNIAQYGEIPLVPTEPVDDGPEENVDVNAVESEYAIVGGGEGGIPLVPTEPVDDGPEENVDVNAVESGYASVGGGEEEEESQIEYYRCGPKYTPGIGIMGAYEGSEVKIIHEILLLHGASFTKEDWLRSGILKMLCADVDNNPTVSFSVTAIDLPVSVDGVQFRNAFDALVGKGVISGMPLAVVSPSASGKGIVDLAFMTAEARKNEDPAATDGHETPLNHIVSAWVPVAAGAILETTDDALLEFPKANIPILSIHGSQDGMGKESTNRLIDVAKSTGLTLGKNHPCYFDEPQEFVKVIREFITNYEKDN